MSVMFEDVHSKLDQKLSRNRTPGADFDEVTYADDTICFSTDSRTINQFIQAVEEEGFRYRLKPNKENMN